ncbi:MAG: alpha-amylase family glycosyl hydrolase [Treponemataceae bacterium]|nr:alpha-amylase family glycosyl hydrolase [Treponemataceae bacterium]
MEFHINRRIRDLCGFDKALFSYDGNVIFRDFKAVRVFAQKVNNAMKNLLPSDQLLKAGQINAMGLIDEIFHHVCAEFRKQQNPEAFEELLSYLEADLGKDSVNALISEFSAEFPPVAVYAGQISQEEYLASSTDGISNRVATLEEMVLLHLASENPAMAQFSMLFGDDVLAENPDYAASWAKIQEFFKKQPLFGPNYTDLISMLREPALFSPNSLRGQLDYIRQHWVSVLGEMIQRLLLSGIDMIAEEEKPSWQGFGGGAGGQGGGGLPPMEPYNYDSLMKEYERFSPDREWMPRVVLMAKTVLVWLDQLSKKYGRSIRTLDQIPDEELDTLANQGFTGLWLIGLWERSWGSKRIKQKCGNPEAAASAYSLHDYDIAKELGGWPALENLRYRLWCRGIRLASDMVPNHTGLDSKWVVERPDLFVQTRECPFPGYTFTGENLSLDPRISVYLEDHYYSKDDCAVVYKRVDNATGDVRYLYHGNDGTGLPWNDTAQIDFLNPQAREEVIQKILHVARNFPIIRFDAAMVLAKKHIRRLWYPEPGQGGDIASRSEYAMSRNDFENAIPNEFWREVVDRCAQEVPDTLLLAEAFWMMEGYFVRTLGMHRVYNSAFMNMLKKEENQKYRDTVKNTMEFDPEVLKRFVNFMNNPDEETAVAQFGRDDKYFGVCTLMVTMPGLPMFGHGQIEGFEEKYGMEYTKAYKDEQPNLGLIARHEHDIFPLMKKRYLFSGIENFCFFDVWNNGSVNENVFAYSNRSGSERAVVFYNNVYQSAAGWIRMSCPSAVKDENGNIRHETKSVAQALNLSSAPDTFLIFQEQRSGLWYIRENAALEREGMFISLNGFEYQVLLNMYEVTDDATGKWRTLCSYLNGKGMRNVDVALKEVYLKDLYGTLTGALSPEFVSDAVDACVKKAKVPASKKAKKAAAKADSAAVTVAEPVKPVKKLADVLAAEKPAAMAYFEKLGEFVAAGYGAEETLTALRFAEISAEPAEENISETAASGKAAEKEAKKAAAKAAAAQAKKIAAAEKAVSKIVAPADKTEWSVRAEKAWKAFEKRIKALAALKLTDRTEAEALCGFAFAFALNEMCGKTATAEDVQTLIELWRLDRKTRDLLSDAGSSYDKLFPLFRIFVDAVLTAGTVLSPANADESLYRAYSAFLESPRAFDTIGANSFDNVVWFNKEKLELCRKVAADFYRMFAVKKPDAKLLTKVIGKFDAAAEKAEYKAEVLAELLEPEEESTEE